MTIFRFEKKDKEPKPDGLTELEKQAEINIQKKKKEEEQRKARNERIKRETLKK